MVLDFSEIYSMYYKRLYLIAYSITRDRYFAEDIVQETFIKAMNKLDSIEEERKMGAWLSVIATRTAIDFIRREKKRSAVLMDQETLEFIGKEMNQNVLQEVEASCLFDSIRSAASKLSHEQQGLLSLKVLKGLKEEEIAHLLQLNPCTVKTKIYRARKKLRTLVFETKIA